MKCSHEGMMTYEFELGFLPSQELVYLVYRNSINSRIFSFDSLKNQRIIIREKQLNRFKAGRAKYDGTQNL